MKSGVLTNARWNCLIILIIATVVLIAPVASGDIWVPPSTAGGVDPTNSYCKVGGNDPFFNMKLDQLYPAKFQAFPEINTVEGFIPVAGVWNPVGYGFEIFPYFDAAGWTSFDWRCTSPVGAVLVKSADCRWVYEYFNGAPFDGTYYHDEGLWSPSTNTNGVIQGISHAQAGLFIPEFPVMACGLLGVLGVMGMVYYQRSRKE